MKIKTYLPDHIWRFIKTWEGGNTVTNDSDDTGGLTKYGISQVNNPDVDVRNLTEVDAEILFYERYYLASKCDRIHPFMSLVQMNCAVNCGVRTAIKCLQKTIGAKPDGVFGEKTFNKVSNYSKSPRIFISWYLTHQAMYYFNIVERKRSQHKWLKGWIRRTIDAAWLSAVKYGKSNI
jgi:lysozyme family protein